MNTTTQNRLKRTYGTPSIESVKLDSDISLALESPNPAPAPGEPGWGKNMMGQPSNEVFKDGLA